MNILMIAGRVPHPPFDGGTTRIYHLAQQWSRRHDLTVVAPQFAPLDPGMLARCAREMGAELRGVPVRLQPRLRRAAQYARQAIRCGPACDYYPELAAALGEMARQRPPDVVEFEGSGAGLYLPALTPPRARSRVVLVFYDVMWDWWRRQFLASPTPMALVRWFTHRIWEPRLVQQADCCVFLSERDAALVAGAARPKTSLVVPNGIDAGRFALESPPEQAEVLFVGSLAHLPNRQAVRWLLGEIWPALLRRVPGAHLTIVGREPTPELTVLARAAGATLAGDAPDVVPYYTRARAVVVPILAGGGIRIKVLEALAAGRPVVSTRLGAEGLPLEPGRHYLLADGVEEIASALARLLADRHLCEQLARRGRELVTREFTWEALAARQERAFGMKGQA